MNQNISDNPLKVEIEYRDSFVFTEDFEGKRFDRYVKKVKEFIYENYLYDVYFNIINTHSCNNLIDFIIRFFQTYYLGDWGKEYQLEGTLFDNLHKYAVPNFDSRSDMDFLKKYLTHPYLEDKDTLATLENVIEKEIKMVCKNFIRERTLELGNIDISNYFLTLPQTTIHAILLFDSIINYVKVDIDNLCSSQASNHMRDLLKDDIVYFLKEENKTLKSNTEELKEKLSSRENDINVLNRKIASKSNGKANSDELILEQNSILERQNSKLKDKYNKLLCKYEILKKQINENILDFEEQEETLKELDKNGNYLFICYEDVTFKRTVLNEFPNASFCESNININASSIDLVIILTEHIDHSTYYAIKEQCKNKNIPLVHCRFSNLQLMKELMWNSLNF